MFDLELYCAAKYAPQPFPLGREPVNLKRAARKMTMRFVSANENAQLLLIQTKVYGIDRQITAEGRDGCKRRWPVGLEKCGTKTS
jgi:hypothetical protein